MTRAWNNLGCWVDIEPKWRQNGVMKKVPSDTPAQPPSRLNLRLAPEILDFIDASCAARSGSVSRNTWIIEAIQEKLASEKPTAHVKRKG